MKKVTRVLCVLLTLCLIFGMGPAYVLAAGSSLPFTDVKKADWFYDAVEFVYDSGMMNGTGAETFSPDHPTTRGMIVTILHRMEGEPSAAGEPFADVSSGRYDFDAVAWASANGIVGGYGDGTFGPDDRITREQLATILYRYAQFKGMDVSVGEDTNILSYEDAFTVSEYAYPALQWACGAGLIHGTDGCLMPKGNATRAQVAAILMRFCESDEEQVPVVVPVPAPVVYYTVTFESNGGSTVESQRVAAGKTVEEPEEPTKENYHFTAWYADEDLTEVYDFTAAVRKDLTLYAGWQEKSESELYYESNGEVVEIIDAAASETVPTEAEVKTMLEELGFDENPVTYEMTLDTEAEVSADSAEKHPMYRTFYQSEQGELWSVYVINGELFADPLSFNLESDLGVRVLVSMSEQVTSYDEDTNRFYVTVPHESAVLLQTVEQIDAETLNGLTIAALCELTGATLPEPEVEEEDEPVEEVAASFSLRRMQEPVEALSAETYSSEDPMIVVSLGDSYSAGEGIEPFYGQSKSLFDKVEDLDWLAHRSEKSWPGRLKIPGVEGTMADYRVDFGETSTAPVQWYFTAVSGAVCNNVTPPQGPGVDTRQVKEYRKSYSDGITLNKYWKIGSETMPYQLDVFNSIQGDVDYVTMTIGGNDVNFAEIVTTCAANFKYLQFAGSLEDMLAEIWEGFPTTKARIRGIYEAVADAAGPQAAIIVAGYPKLLAKGGLINAEEAKLVNQKVSEFNDELESLIHECSADGLNIYFADVEPAFDADGGHQAYSKKNGVDQAWINPIWLLKKPQDLSDTGVGSAYSIHPNGKGAAAYAKCVNNVIKEIEEERRTIKNITGVITIADTDTDMTNNLPLEGAEVVLEYASFMDKVATTDSDGVYTLTRIPIGTYQITVSREGFIPVTETITVSENDAENIFNITIEAIPEAYEGDGYASGTIYDVGTGLPVSDMTLYIRAGLGNTTGEILSSMYLYDTADYTTPALAAGNYTVQIADERGGIEDEERYITSSFHIKVLGDMTIGNQNGYISNGLGAEELRIVLTWGANPSDLDSHLVGPTADGGKFHVYYSDQSYGSEADLDVDDTSSYGPETITIHNFREGTYTYAIHDYSNRYASYSTAMSSSGAQVQVFRGATLIATYHVPVNTDGTLWTVFTYDGETNRITPVNTMSYDETSGGSLLSVMAVAEPMQDVAAMDVIDLILQDVKGNKKETLLQ